MIRCTAEECRYNYNQVCVSDDIHLTLNEGDRPECVNFEETEPSVEQQAIDLLQKAQAALPDAWLAQDGVPADLINQIDKFLSNHK
jgi:hypothetical protein